jgi:hypothetical protein
MPLWFYILFGLYSIPLVLVTLQVIALVMLKLQVLILKIFYKGVT